MINFIAWWWSK